MSEPPRDSWQIDPGSEDGEEVPPPPQPPPKPPRGLASVGVSVSSRWYSRFVGFAFLAVIAIAVVNGFHSVDGGSTIGDDSIGSPLVEFAVPDARGSLDGDANIAQDDCEVSANPCPPDRVRTPACEVDEPGALRVCDYFNRPLIISFWFTRGADCLGTEDAFDAASRRWKGRVNFLSINVRDDPAEVRQIVSDRGWQVPVGYDRDGAVSGLYGVIVCPTLQSASPGGILAGTEIGDLDRDRIDQLARRLLGR